VELSRGSRKGFSRGGPKMVKFHFSRSKLRKEAFLVKNFTEKSQVSKSMLVVSGSREV